MFSCIYIQFFFQRRDLHCHAAQEMAFTIHILLVELGTSLYFYVQFFIFPSHVVESMVLYSPAHCVIFSVSFRLSLSKHVYACFTLSTIKKNSKHKLYKRIFMKKAAVVQAFATQL